jgi:hypothetical protein
VSYQIETKLAPAPNCREWVWGKAGRDLKITGRTQRQQQHDCTKSNYPWKKRKKNTHNAHSHRSKKFQGAPARPPAKWMHSGARRNINKNSVSFRVRALATSASAAQVLKYHTHPAAVSPLFCMLAETLAAVLKKKIKKETDTLLCEFGENLRPG